MQMFERELFQAGHTRRFTVTEARPLGWEVRVEEDSQVVHSVRYSDWHRVERAMALLAQQIVELERNGWRGSRTRDTSPTADGPHRR